MPAKVGYGGKGMKGGFKSAISKKAPASATKTAIKIA